MTAQAQNRGDHNGKTAYVSTFCECVCASKGVYNADGSPAHITSANRTSNFGSRSMDHVSVGERRVGGSQRVRT